MTFTKKQKQLSILFLALILIGGVIYYTQFGPIKPLERDARAVIYVEVERFTIENPKHIRKAVKKAFTQEGVYTSKYNEETLELIIHFDKKVLTKEKIQSFLNNHGVKVAHVPSKRLQMVDFNLNF